MNEISILPNLINKPENISKLKIDEISQILKTVKNIFEEENLLIKFSIEEKAEEVYVIGDIHGNLETLMKLVEIINKNNPKIVIFLGDIVDRGPKQFECLLIVLALKILYPSRYYFLRGNHETVEMNQIYGFFQDFIHRFNEKIDFNEILNIYNVLPLCALINETILCLHGGIPQDIDILKRLEDLKGKDFNRVFKSIEKEIFQIMWNDPKDGLKGFSNSFRGPGIKFYGIEAFGNFMKANNLKYLIRAHECFSEGYRWFFNKRLLSIFTSANYRGLYAPNPASYAVIKNDEIIPKFIE